MRMAVAGIIVLCLNGLTFASDGEPSSAAQRAERLKQVDKELVKLLQKSEKQLLANKTKYQKVLTLPQFADSATQLKNEQAAKALALAKEKLDDNVGYDALQYALLTAKLDSPVQKEARQLIIDNHLSNPKLESALPDLCLNNREYDRELIQKIIDTNPSISVKALSTFTLGLANELDFLSAKTQDSEIFPKMRDSMAQFEKAAAGYGKVAVKGNYYQGKIADLAKREIEAIRKSPVGKPAPETSGVDFGGVPFSLKEYQGKVVLLYFDSFC